MTQKLTGLEIINPFPNYDLGMWKAVKEHSPVLVAETIHGIVELRVSASSAPVTATWDASWELITPHHGLKR